MKKSKRVLCAAIAAALTLGVSSMALVGCVATNNEEDVKQVIAEIDISKDSALSDEFGEYANAIGKDKILKRDLLLAYINVGSNYSGTSTGEVFQTLLESLVNNSVVTQYATVALLQDKVENKDKEGYDSSFSLSEFKAVDSDTLDGEIEKYEYLLGGKDSYGVKESKYSLYKLLNNTLDSYERSFVEEEEEYSGTATRSTPSGVDVEKKDYAHDNYGIYTGYKGYLLEDAGEYEAINGSRRDTRRKAYAALISYLKTNYMASSEDKDTTDILSLTYVKESYLSYLKSQVINEYGKLFEKQQQEAIDVTENEGGVEVYTYVREQYENVKDGELTKQKDTYSKASDFESAMSSLSDSKFILYSPDTTQNTEEKDGTYGTYGYVYNILLPFSATQEIKLKELDSRRTTKNITDTQYFVARNELLKDIKTYDQREAWFNGSTDYSFNASENGKLTDWYGKSSGKNYLFFENNLTDTERYEPLNKYYGKYAYNGTVSKNKNGSYFLIPEELTIDGMLSEFKSYVNYVLNDGKGQSKDYVSIYEGDKMQTPYSVTNNAYYDYSGSRSVYVSGSDKEIDYSNFVYVTGKVDVTDDNGNKIKADDMFVADSNRYKAMSAVNELQYAYTTDPGILSQYIGYSVSAYTTSYIKEFEYAAQQVLRMGEGYFKVCAGSYGWHLIYATQTYSFEGGNVYSPSWTADRIETEGTFENVFYNWIKDAALSTEVSRKQSNIVTSYNSDTTVKLYTKAYKDLTELK